MKKIEKLNKTKSKIKKNWSKYQIKKSKILNQKLSSEKKQQKIKNLFQETKNVNKEYWSEYNDFLFDSGLKKYSYNHWSDIEQNEVKYSTYYCKKTDENILQDFLEKHRSDDNLKFIIITVEFFNEETKQIHNYSYSFTKFSLNDTLNILNESSFIGDDEFTEYDNILQIVLQKFENYGQSLKMIGNFIKLIYNK